MPMWTVESSTRATPWIPVAPRHRRARKRWVSVTVAGFSALPNGRDLSTSPAITESVSRTKASIPDARASIQNVGSELTLTRPRA